MKSITLLRRFLRCILFFSALNVEVSAISLRKRHSPSNWGVKFEETSRQLTLADDQLFWGEMATGTESELRRCYEVVGYNHKMDEQFAGLQETHNLTASNGKKMDPMIGMLDSLYSDSKRRIVKLNQHEEQSKQRFMTHQRSHQDRMREIETEFNNRQNIQMSEALRANETALKNHLENEENFFSKYWGRVRDRNHKQYHTFLKIQHGLMDRLKTMRDALEQAETQQGAHDAQTSEPDVAAAVLIQHTNFVQDSIEAVVALHAELAVWD